MDLSTIMTINAYSDEQPRGNDGKWTDGPAQIGHGDVKPRNEYDQEANSAVLDTLKKQGFKQSGVNSDPHHPMTFRTDTDKGERGKTGPSYAGHSTHSVIVYPNGEWEHTSEGSHSGFGADGLGFLKQAIAMDSAAQKKKKK